MLPCFSFKFIHKETLSHNMITVVPNYKTFATDHSLYRHSGTGATHWKLDTHGHFRSQRLPARPNVTGLA
ncbi:MAG: hypothetical protein DSZ23_02055 [Thermodesulfatator sp.]|nr:MAG: hypothetical protein DSZ23_02055 [Thermodesulfatator sp.]